MSQRVTPWGQALDALLADGQWHNVEAVMATVTPTVPPGPAYRNGERLRTRRGRNSGERVQGSAATAVASGARRKVAEAIRARERHGQVEVVQADGRASIRRVARRVARP